MQAQLTTPTFGDPRLPARFWAKVNPNGPIPAQRPELGPCWEWTAYRNHDDYGTFGIGSRTDDSARMALAHRHAYETLIGPILEGLESDHLCRNPACVRPTHIEPVTSAVNSQRSPLVGRHGKARGEAHGQAKLRATDIPTIRVLRGKVSQETLAARYSVSQRQIGRIQRREKWSHL